MDQNTLRRRGAGLIAFDPDAASPGYTLFAPLTGTSQVFLIRLDGTVAHQWDLPYRPGRHPRLLANGNLAYNGTLPDVPVLFPMWLRYHGRAAEHLDPARYPLQPHYRRDHQSVTYSRVIEVDRRTQAITWQYRDSPPENFFTPFMGSAQRLPNGNTLVT